MRNKKHLKIFAVMFALIMALCMSTVIANAATKKVAISAKSQTVYVGTKNKSLGVKVTSGAKVTYKSSAPSIVSVTSTGKITAKKAGSAKITIKASKKGYTTATKVITIKSVKRNQTITASNLSVYVGSTKAIGAKAKTTLSYKSSNTGIVTVSSKGVLTGKKAGTAYVTITAKATTKYKAATKKIKVTIVKKSTTITASNVSVTVGSTKSIGAKSSSGGALSYKSADTKIATVNSKGVVKGITPGTTTIKITSKATSKCKAGSKSIKVVVSPKTVDQTITASDLTLKVGESGNVNASAKTALTYKSLNADIATVDEKGNVKALKAGMAMIQIDAAASSTYNKATKSVTVTVSLKDQTITASDLALKVGETGSVKATASTTLSYTSSNTDVATVDASGNVTAMKEGTCTIHITAVEDGTFKGASKDVTVTVVPAELKAQEITASNVSMTVGETKGINATASTTLTYESSDVNVATVDASGNVAAIKEGTCTIRITAKEENGFKGISKDITISVSPAPVVEVNREVVHHDAVTHTEEVVIKDAWTEEVPVYETRPIVDGYFCNTCGEEMSYGNEHWDRDTKILDEYETKACEAYYAGNQEEYSKYAALAEEALNNRHNGYHSTFIGETQVQVGTETVNHPAETELRTIVDQAAYDEVITTYSDGTKKTEKVVCTH